MVNYEKVWQLQDAKAKFSEFVREAIVSPQVVSIRGEKKVVMVSLNYFRQMACIKPSLKGLLESVPIKFK